MGVKRMGDYILLCWCNTCQFSVFKASFYSEDWKAIFITKLLNKSLPTTHCFTKRYVSPCYSTCCSCVHYSPYYNQENSKWTVESNSVEKCLIICRIMRIQWVLSKSILVCWDTFSYNTNIFSKMAQNRSTYTHKLLHMFHTDVCINKDCPSGWGYLGGF